MHDVFKKLLWERRFRAASSLTEGLAVLAALVHGAVVVVRAELALESAEIAVPVGAHVDADGVSPPGAVGACRHQAHLAPQKGCLQSGGVEKPRP